MNGFIRETLRTLCSLAVTVALFVPMYLFVRARLATDGGFDFRSLKLVDQFISIGLAMYPFPTYAWLCKRFPVLRRYALRKDDA